MTFQINELTAADMRNAVMEGTLTMGMLYAAVLPAREVYKLDQFTLLNIQGRMVDHIFKVAKRDPQKHAECWHACRELVESTKVLSGTNFHLWGGYRQLYMDIGHLVEAQSANEGTWMLNAPMFVAAAIAKNVRCIQPAGKDRASEVIRTHKLWNYIGIAIDAYSVLQMNMFKIEWADSQEQSFKCGTSDRNALAVVPKRFLNEEQGVIKPEEVEANTPGDLSPSPPPSSSSAGVEKDVIITRVQAVEPAGAIVPTAQLASPNQAPGMTNSQEVKRNMVGNSNQLPGAGAMEHGLTITRKEALEAAGDLLEKLASTTHDQPALSGKMKEWLSEPRIRVMPNEIKFKIWAWCNDHDRRWLGVIESATQDLAVYTFAVKKQTPRMNQVTKVFESPIMQLRARAQAQGDLKERETLSRIAAQLTHATQHCSKMFETTVGRLQTELHNAKMTENQNRTMFEANERERASLKQYRDFLNKTRIDSDEERNKNVGFLQQEGEAIRRARAQNAQWMAQQRTVLSQERAAMEKEHIDNVCTVQREYATIAEERALLVGLRRGVDDSKEMFNTAVKRARLERDVGSPSPVPQPACITPPRT